MSISENIRVGSPAAFDNEVKEAARFVQCPEFIEEFENSWNSFAGNGGAKLSGAAPAHYHSVLRNAPVLILNEAVSHTGAENRRQLQLSLQVLCKNKTVISIARNLAALRHARQIPVIENGSIVRRGTHDSLIREDGRYKELRELSEN